MTSVDLLKIPFGNSGWPRSWQAVLRGYDRLAAAGLCDGRHCHLCQHPDGDLEHLIWECAVFADSRAPYLDATNTCVEEVRKVDPVRAQWLSDLLAKPCVRNCGLFPDDQALHDESNIPCAVNGHFCMRPQGSTEELLRDAVGQRYRDGKLLMFIDGSAFNQLDHRRTRAG